MACEREICRKVKHIIAVSSNDARAMRDLFGVSNVSEVPTGVDLDYFRAPETPAQRKADLVFVGSMAWLPNIDGSAYFTDQILPLIRARRPQCSLAIAGREPVHAVRELAQKDPLIQVTGTVPDVRPYLWGSAVSIVPLRVGGGTRLKIYEAMAAGVPVVSTTIGAEGLDLADGAHIRLADTPELFARHCLELLEDRDERERLAARALDLVTRRFSWDRSTEIFENILGPAAAPREAPAACSGIAH
jgi:glycosyltransferase involved in cell wall biosynthesis